MVVGEQNAPDHVLDEVVAWFGAMSQLEVRLAGILRRALDEVIDGGRTGRWSVASLEKTEKTYIGTKVEILLKYELSLPRGLKLDTNIAGHEVDIKCTVKSNWMIPREALGEICLLVLIDDANCRFQVGLIRVDESTLTLGQNRDGKRSISAASKKKIQWLVEHGTLTPNLLATLSEEVRSRVLSFRSGQLRVNELFRQVKGRVINRNALETVARQLDPMKRMRDARKILVGEGILVIGHQDDDPETALRYGLPVPKKGEAIAIDADPSIQPPKDLDPP